MAAGPIVQGHSVPGTIRDSLADNLSGPIGRAPVHSRSRVGPRAARRGLAKDGCNPYACRGSGRPSRPRAIGGTSGKFSYLIRIKHDTQKPIHAGGGRSSGLDLAVESPLKHDQDRAESHRGPCWRSVLFNRILILLIMVIPAWGAWAASDDSDPEVLSGLSIEELMDVPVVSTSKKQVRLAETTAAVYVITADDIRRFGFTSVPEALRLVPGVNVARMNSGSWAISVRGFNGWLANKLLIMIDGRSVYTPLFSGVFWENLDVVMADIERIEVVRGPGATIWGANAVNGVINIITKDASRTTGGLVTAGGGDAEQVHGVLRIGDALGDNSWIRGFVKYRQNAPVVSVSTDQTMNDEHWIAVAGFRSDILAGDDEEMSLQGTFTRSDFDQERTTWLGLEPPYSVAGKTDDRIAETQLTADWHKVLSESSDLSLQIFWDTQHIHYVGVRGIVSRFDIDFNHHFRSGQHEIVWGAGYRLVDAEVEGTFDFDFDKPYAQDFNLNAFIQDDVTLLADRLGLVVGSKLEYNTRTEFEIQPNLRFPLDAPQQPLDLGCGLPRRSYAVHRRAPDLRDQRSGSAGRARSGHARGPSHLPRQRGLFSREARGLRGRVPRAAFELRCRGPGRLLQRLRRPAERRTAGPGSGLRRHHPLHPDCGHHRAGSRRRGLRRRSRPGSATGAVVPPTGRLFPDQDRRDRQAGSRRPHTGPAPPATRRVIRDTSGSRWTFRPGSAWTPPGAMWTSWPSPRSRTTTSSICT